MSETYNDALEQVLKLIDTYPSKMREAPVYYYDSDYSDKPQPIPFSDFLGTPDLEDARQLNVILTNGNKWHWYSDIRNDEMNDTLDAAIAKALQPLKESILTLKKE